MRWYRRRCQAFSESSGRRETGECGDGRGARRRRGRAGKREVGTAEGGGGGRVKFALYVLMLIEFGSFRWCR